MFPPNVFFIKIEKALSSALPDVSLLFIVIIDVGFAKAKKTRPMLKRTHFFIFILKANPEPCIFISFQSSCPESPPPADKHHSKPFCFFATNMLMI